MMMCVNSSFRKLDSEREERCGGHGGVCGPKAVGLQQCFSNWDL